MTSSWSIGDSKSLVESGPFHSQGRGGVSNHYHYHWERWVIIVGKRVDDADISVLFFRLAFLASGHVHTVLFVFWSNMPFNGISRYFEANFEFLLLCYFSAWAFRLCYFLHFFQLWSQDVLICSLDALMCSQMFSRRSQMFSKCEHRFWAFSDVLRCYQDVLRMFSGCSQNVLRIASGGSQHILRILWWVLWDWWGFWV